MLLGYIKSGRLRELGRQTWNKIGAGCFGFGAESANSKYGVQLDDLATLGCVEAIRCQIQILGSNKHFGADQQLGARNSFLGTRNKYSPFENDDRKAKTWSFNGSRHHFSPKISHFRA